MTKGFLKANLVLLSWIQLVLLAAPWLVLDHSNRHQRQTHAYSCSLQTQKDYSPELMSRCLDN